MSKVTAIRPANDAPAAAPEMLLPFDISVSANFADLQQVMIRMPVASAVDRGEANRLMDLAVDMAQRQVSRQEIRLNEAALKDKRKALELQRGRQTEEQAKHAAAISAVEKDIVATETRRAEHEQGFVTAERNRGKTGDIVLVGAAKNRDIALAKDVDRLREKIRTLEADYQQKVVAAQAQIIERLTEEIAAIERLLEKHREIVG